MMSTELVNVEDAGFDDGTADPDMMQECPACWG
jgi:hypothetical protein